MSKITAFIVFHNGSIFADGEGYTDFYEDIFIYVHGVDTAEYSAIVFRKFLEYLRDNTHADRIHILAYSAGTKLTAQALHQYIMLEKGRADVPQDTTGIGRVLFAAGDVERQLFGICFTDGLLDSVDSLTIYMSDTDKALNASESIRKYPRLGQYWGDSGPGQEAADFVRGSGRLYFIKV
jgi:esterase/lipase superfamily enzyme